MQLHVDDLENITRTLKKFPKAKTFKLRSYHSGIGSCLKLSFDYMINDTETKITIDLTDVSKW